VAVVRLEFELGDLAFGGVPRWVVLAIIPAGFGLMGWRFMVRVLAPTLPADRSFDITEPR